jgi:putative ABC transport system ATP-binding protein
MPTPPSILRVDRLTKTYATAAGRLTVLNGVSLDLEAGATLAIVGPSGSGKTTLLGLCAGLDRATTGSVFLAGESLDGLDEDARARVRNQHVGFVFQNYQLIPTLTAYENVLVPVELRGERKRGPDALELLVRVGLGERRDHYPIQLSGGEQQRVALARALAPGPRLLLADEPTGNLDIATGRMVMDLLFALCGAAKATLLLITHDPALAARCGRTVTLRDGMIAA